MLKWTKAIQFATRRRMWVISTILLYRNVIIIQFHSHIIIIIIKTVLSWSSLGGTVCFFSNFLSSFVASDVLHRPSSLPTKTDHVSMKLSPAHAPHTFLVIMCPPHLLAFTLFFCPLSMGISLVLLFSFVCCPLASAWF